MKSLIAGAFAAALAMPLAAPIAIAGDGVMAMDPHAFATAPTAKAGGAYVSLMNHGPADRLVSAAGDVAKRIEIHEHSMTDGVMRMRKVEGGIALPEDGAITMKPGGYHVMLMGLNAPLTAGESFPLTLTFESGAELSVTVEVRKRGASHGHSGQSGHSTSD